MTVEASVIFEIYSEYLIIMNGGLKLVYNIGWLFQVFPSTEILFCQPNLSQIFEIFLIHIKHCFHFIVM